MTNDSSSGVRGKTTLVSACAPAEEKPLMTQRRGASKRYANKHEQRFAELAQSLGWGVSKRGWPDFRCFDDLGNMIAVEVKPPGQLLRREQWETMKTLSALGIKCFVSDGRVLTPIDHEKMPDFYPELDDGR